MSWVSLIAGATLAGASVVALLIVPKRAEPLAGMTIAGCLAWSVWGFVDLVRVHDRSDLALAAVVLALASLATGYLLGASLLHLLATRPGTTPIPEPRDDEPRTGVIVLADAEPEHYSPRQTARDIAELAEAEGPTAPLAVQPFFFAGERTRYHAAGDRSPARDTVRAIVRRTAELLDRDAFSAPLTAYAFGSPTLTEAAAALTATGHRTIVVCALGVAEGRPHELAKRALDAASPGRSAVRVEYAPPLWTSDDLAALVASRVLRASEGVESTTGAALVVHGQPPAWSRDFPDHETREVAFCHRVRALLIEGGLIDANLRLAWDAWREPDIPEVARHLAAIGCSRVFIVPACDPIDSLATLFDLQHAADFARVSVPTRVMPAWNDAPEVAQTLADSVIRTAREIAGE
ncbi:MAG: hypothetical protein C0418_00850 [Coriobacteriaceae bacterium]|nr:hypothetical protein [Coriobacteriaceae bacterium]